MKDRLYESLREYGENDYYPFHMPGHKRNPGSGPMSGIYGLDITEIDDFDNLHQPEGMLREAMERAAALYGSEETYFLINGSTAGILSAVSAIAGRGKKLLIARNCHKAVYHAAFLNRLDIEYIYPPILEDFGITGGISAHQMEERIRTIAKREKIPLSEISHLVAGVVITSPTYDGILSESEEIVKTVHSYGIPIILDQAHGAHFGFHPGFPQSGVKEGADLVIHSLHKTLPAPTQTALLHRSGVLTDGELLRKYLRIYQTSSPSYVLMAGIDSCIDLVREEGSAKLNELLSHRRELWQQTLHLKYIHIYPSMAEGQNHRLTGSERNQSVEWYSGAGEPGRLIISVRGSNMTGKELYDRLRNTYHLQMEMYGWDYVIGICSMMDEREGFLRLAGALFEIDAELSEGDKSDLAKWPQPETILSVFEAYAAEGEYCSLEESEGRIAADFVNLYPPGIPLLVPGEKIDGNVITVLGHYLSKGYPVQGIEQENQIKCYIERMEE